MARSAAALSLDTVVSTQSLFFTAWMAASLFGRSLYSWATNDDEGDEPIRPISNSALCLTHFRRVTKQLALTESQQAAIDQAVSQLQPLIVQLLAELNEKQRALAALQPGDNDFLHKSGRLSNDIGTLATQLALTSSKLKTDVYAILNTSQKAVLGELQTAFELYAC